MEKTNIGFKAGIILEKLGETGLITIAELARRLNFAADDVDQGEGQLSAKPKLENTAAEKIGELISPAEIAKGTTVHFRATHSKSWTIMYWKVNGVIIRSVEPEQTFVIDEHKEVRVAFKPYKSPEPEGL